MRLLGMAGKFVLAGGGLATVFSFLGRFGWFFDLFAHFHLPYAIVLSVVAIGFVAARQRVPLAISLLLLVPHLVCLGYYVPLGKPVAAGDSPVLKVVTFNVLSGNRRHGEVLEFLGRSDADVILLVEVNAWWIDALRPIEKTHPHIRQIPRSDNFGMALYSRFPIRSGETMTLPPGLPCLLARLDWSGKEFTVIGAHPMPPIGAGGALSRDRYLEELGVLARHEAAGSEVIVLGDLNTTPWSHGFRELLESAGLRDSGRHRGFQSSWMRLNPVFSLPLDHILHSPGLETIDRRVGPDLGSDHRPVAGSLRQRPAGGS